MQHTRRFQGSVMYGVPPAEPTEPASSAINLLSSSHTPTTRTKAISIDLPLYSHQYLDAGTCQSNQNTPLSMHKNRIYLHTTIRMCEAPTAHSIATLLAPYRLQRPRVGLWYARFSSWYSVCVFLLRARFDLASASSSCSFVRGAVFLL